MVAATTATSPSACATAHTRPDCCTASPVRPASPSVRARLCSAASCPTTRPWLSWPTSPMAAASARPHASPASARTRSPAWPAAPATTPANSTTNWRAFPPSTTKLQVDEKWSFVGKNEKHCEPARNQAEQCCGDQWDHVAFDPDSRLVLGVLVGRRITENAVRLLRDIKVRLGGRCPEQITTDEYSVYPEAILEVFGVSVVPPRTGKPGRPAGPRRVPPEELRYTTVHKTRQQGRVVKVETRTIFGPVCREEKASTSYLERQNGTDRHRNARKGRKTYRFSKDWEIHEAMTNFTMYSYNFCWAVRTLRVKGEKGRWQQRTPAMVAGLADHVWSLKEWLTLPAVQRK